MSPLIATLRANPRMPAARLREALGVSPATLMRAVRAAGPSVLAIGRARRSAYAARRALRGLEAPLPLFAVDARGQATHVAQMHLAYPHGCVMEWQGPCPWPLDDVMRDGWFEGIPYLLQDLRPEGFLGRAFARRHAGVLQVSEDPRHWSDDDVLHAMSLLGADLGGHFIVGEAACRLWMDQKLRPPRPVADAELGSVYPDLAQRAMEQGEVGSSAGGEFPKFTAVRVRGLEVHHVIVKFSGLDRSAASRRWSDLLVCEHLALQCVGRLPGLEAPRSCVHEAGGRTFLEVVRFDRQGLHGRLPLCSWAAVHHDWTGLAGRPWDEGAQGLHRQGLIDRATVEAVTRLMHFGRLIGNSDMHDGNLALVPGAPGMRLAPVYDMLPMAYAPGRGVEVTSRPLTPSLPLPAEREAWREAAASAVEFWERASADQRISKGFRHLCERNARAVSDAVAQAGLSGAVAGIRHPPAC